MNCVFVSRFFGWSFYLKIAVDSANHKGHTNIFYVQNSVSGWYYNSSCDLKG